LRREESGRYPQKDKQAVKLHCARSLNKVAGKKSSGTTQLVKLPWNSTGESSEILKIDIGVRTKIGRGGDRGSCKNEKRVNGI